MRKITRYFSLALLLAVFSACNVMDQKPYNAVLRSELSAEDIPFLYTGLYNLAQYKPTENGYLQGDFCGGDFIINGTTTYASAGQWIQSLVVPTSSYIHGPWNGYYACIYQINEFIDLVARQTYNPDYGAMVGTARFFRALMYYNLVTRWRDVPLIVHNTEAAVPATPEADCWAFVEEDLQAAIAACPDFTSKWYVSKQAAQALMARALLAQGKKAEAAVYSEAVIASGLFALDEVSKIFNGKDNTEEIFSFRNKTDENCVDFADNFYKAKPSYVPTTAVINQYANADKRKDVTIRNYDGTDVLGKYVNQGEEHHQLYIIRLAEMYLISAEGLGYDQGGLARLNALRVHRGLAEKNITDEETMLKAVIYERRLELLGEGFRWFDLVRTGSSPAGLGEKYTVMPMPSRELNLNHLLKQNDLWK
ncbi:MAG: RagB/SusD family nutrient uptake outer membrane protein [Bacteroidales bacterium]|nr:RagB/SusD family nutrient uptake outer membrane protein [Bacteroidales bacterium]